jgi:hypothetical protein
MGSSVAGTDATRAGEPQANGCYTISVTPLHGSVVAVILPCVGEWLSLVEHLVRDQGVGGSNPLSPTTVFQSLTFS